MQTTQHWKDKENLKGTLIPNCLADETDQSLSKDMPNSGLLQAGDHRDDDGMQ